MLLLVLYGLLFSLHIPECSAATDTISPGHVVAGNDRLISGNGKFALGFFQTGSKSSHNSLNTYLGIWFNKVPKQTPVWIANGDNPVIDPTSSELTISRDGNLVVLNQPNKSTIWSTHAIFTTNNTIAVLLDSGNLVLQSSSNSSAIFWQSFDHPTDTVLPGAKIGRNKVTGLNRRLVSRKNLIDPAPGVYTVYSHPKAQCDVYAICGPFAICNENGNPFCKCMKGFSVRSPEDWELEDRTGGCMRNTPLLCGGNENEISLTDRFYSMPSIRLPNNAKYVQAATSGDECAQVCLGNCSCIAYSYGKGGCSIWHDELLNVKQQPDVAADGNGEILYLRLAAKEVQSFLNDSGIIIGIAIGASTTTLGFIFLLIIRTRKGKWSTRTLNNVQGGIGIIAFRYTDLQRATKNFSEKLGGGGFGSVFMGHLSDSATIAVKRLDGARQGEKQFRAEVRSIGIIQHMNLVKLIGFCCEGDRRLLVYEHMPNRSLDAHLFQGNGAILDWAIRYQIAIGVARGLAYLHGSCQDCIIHCDIKPENILLDKYFTPKIADFGMAKFLGRNFSRVVTTMRGTIGYLAPEWISGTAITSKVDVYSYGMVLLEIISGRRNSSKESSSDVDRSVYFPVQAASKLLNGDIESLVDANLHGDVDLEEVKRVCKAACWCIQDNEFDRPTMREVVQFLEGLLELDAPPVPRLLHAIAGGSHSTSL